MDKTEKFKERDRVIRIGTTSPVMTIVGRTVRGGLPYKTTRDKWTCEWQDNGSHRQEINEEDLELSPSN